MKRFILLAAFGLATATALPVSATNLPVSDAFKDDTVLVKLANGAKMSLVVKDTEQLKSFQDYSLDSLMIMLNTYIAKAELMEKMDLSDKDYTVDFRPAEETKDKRRPEKISITMKGLDKNAQGQTKIAKLNVNVEYEDENTHKGDTIGSKCEVDSVKIRKDLNKRHWGGLHLDLGFNTFLNTKDNMLDQAGLKPWGSRYISFNPYYMVRIGGKESPLRLRSGLDFAFNNYMFDNNYVLIESEAGGTSYTEFKKDSRGLDKTKLATSSVNLPLMAIVDFKKPDFRFGVGGFIGYRLGSHTKIKYNQEGDEKKDKDQGNFNLEDLQYGAKFTIGYRGLDLFANYNLNELFKDGRGPNANVLSFGITLF